MRLVLDAQLEDPGPQAPRPGAFHIIAVMHYKVLAVVEGDYPHDHVFVGHHWADLSAPEFQPGARHRLQLTSELPRGASLLNTFDVSTEGVFYCTAFETIERA